jgi:hypothetical protein
MRKNYELFIMEERGREKEEEGEGEGGGTKGGRQRKEEVIHPHLIHAHAP